MENRDKSDRPVPPEELLFNVHMALQRAENLWPSRKRPGDHNRLKPIARAVVAHLDLCGIRCIRKPPVPPHSCPGPER